MTKRRTLATQYLLLEIWVSLGFACEVFNFKFIRIYILNVLLKTLILMCNENNGHLLDIKICSWKASL